MLKRIRKNKKGFTLAELLIVVAIIGVLVAISIPIFTTQLEKSRDAVTLSNIRAAYAEAQASYLLNSDSKKKVEEVEGNQTVTFNPASTTGGDVTVTVTKVASKGQQSGLSGYEQLPFDASALAADKNMADTPKEDWTITFTYKVTSTGTTITAAAA